MHISSPVPVLPGSSMLAQRSTVQLGDISTIPTTNSTSSALLKPQPARTSSLPVQHGPVSLSHQVPRKYRSELAVQTTEPWVQNKT